MLRRAALGLLLTLFVAATSAAPKPKRKPALQAVLWRDPGDVTLRDLSAGPGGRNGVPKPPFRFVEEDLAGTNPKLKVKDVRGAAWIVKWGPEAYASAFSSHLVWACGYSVETEYFVPSGRIAGAQNLKRAAAFVKPDGSFRDARFQLRTKSPAFLKHNNWAWTNNPFLGKPEYNGLRILMMLVSNWDAKDARDLADDGTGHGRADSNLAIFKTPGHHPSYLYLVSDWGASMGKWSPLPPLRTKWDSAGFALQTPEFVKGVHDDEIDWGYSGTHGPDIAKGIRVKDVHWLMRYLGRISDAQLRRGLVASGATPQQVDVYTRALRARIRQLQKIDGTPGT